MNDRLEIFHSQFPTAYYFDEYHLEDLPKYLLNKGLISPGEKIISISKPGEGNMNFVQRIITKRQSIIIKQSRPWVEKYPQLEAPVERLEVEAKYYQFTSRDSFFREYSPDVILYDPENLIIVTEDLGESSDFTFCYKKSKKNHSIQLVSLLNYISYLHNKNWANSKIEFPSNQALKQLNHEHIFNYPYKLENGFDLDTIQIGLQEISLPIKHDSKLKEKISALGKKYLDSGPVLIHGDYYPGSWLVVKNQVKVIDPEFAFFGFAEFDLGVMVANLLMAGITKNEIEKLLPNYKKRSDFDWDLFLGFCGTEMLRRIIGLAQLPLELTLLEKKELIDLSLEFINSPESHQFL